ncbi:MAG: hypothetical protein ACYS0D_13675 [Planctomycetota bacterium]
MIETFVGVALGLVGVYLALGVPVVIALHTRGLRGIDPAVAGAGVLFRVLVTPGILALWPLLFRRWLRARKGAPTAGGVHRPLVARGIRSFHRRLTWTVLAIVPVVAAAAIVLRPGDPSRGAPPTVTTVSPAPLPQVELEKPAPFGSRPLVLRVRRGDGRAQLEIEVRGDLDLPAPALLWEPRDGGPARFLTRIGTPGVRRVDIGSATLERGGTLVLYALGHGERVDTFEIGGSR